MTHLLGRICAAFGQDLVPVDDGSFFRPHPADACPWMAHHLQANSKIFFHPLLEWRAVIPGIRPDHARDEGVFQPEVGAGSCPPRAHRDERSALSPRSLALGCPPAKTVFCPRFFFPPSNPPSSPRTHLV